jgi:hypothetical protein
MRFVAVSSLFFEPRTLRGDSTAIHECSVSLADAEYAGFSRPFGGGGGGRPGGPGGGARPKGSRRNVRARKRSIW